MGPPILSRHGQLSLPLADFFLLLYFTDSDRQNMFGKVWPYSGQNIAQNMLLVFA